MGCITIFTNDGCNDSKRVLSTLAQFSIPFETVNISKHPDRRRDMISLTNSGTTPQIFLNGRHIQGGAEEFLHLLQNWVDEASYAGYETPLERYEMEIENASLTSDPRLANVLNAAPRQLIEEYAYKIANSLNLVILPNGATVAKGDIMRKLLCKIPRRQEISKDDSNTFYNCCTGTDIINALREAYSIDNEADALLFGDELVKSGMIILLSCEKEANNQKSKANKMCCKLTTTSVYRLYSLDKPQILNSLFPWSPDMNKKANPIQITQRLSKQIRDITSIKTSPETEERLDSMYEEFEDAVCQLQTITFDDINVHCLDDNFLGGNATRLAFELNLYNIMIQHYLIEIQRKRTNKSSRASVNIAWPRDDTQIKKFLSNISYNIGGREISAYALSQRIGVTCRSGSSRRNSKSRAKNKSSWFSVCGCNAIDDVVTESDRGINETSPFDPRIYFALTLGTKNSPLVRTYHPKSLDDELQLAANEYCSHHIKINEETETVTLPRLFKWYHPNELVGKTAADTMSKLVNFMSPTQLKLLEETSKNNRIKISYEEFDWKPSLLPSAYKKKIIPSKSKAASLVQKSKKPQANRHENILQLLSDTSTSSQNHESEHTERSRYSPTSLGSLSTLKMTPMQNHISITRRGEEHYDEYSAMKPPRRTPRCVESRYSISGCSSSTGSKVGVISRQSTVSTACSSLSSSYHCPSAISLTSGSSVTSVSSSTAHQTQSRSSRPRKFHYTTEETQSINSELRDILSKATMGILEDDDEEEDDIDTDEEIKQEESDDDGLDSISATTGTYLRKFATTTSSITDISSVISDCNNSKSSKEINDDDCTSYVSYTSSKYPIQYKESIDALSVVSDCSKSSSCISWDMVAVGVPIGGHTMTTATAVASNSSVGSYEC